MRQRNAQDAWTMVYPSGGEELDGYTEAIFGDFWRCHAMSRDFSRFFATLGDLARAADRLSVARLKKNHLITSQKTSPSRRVRILACSSRMVGPRVRQSVRLPSGASWLLPIVFSMAATSGEIDSEWRAARRARMECNTR